MPCCIDLLRKGGADFDAHTSLRCAASSNAAFETTYDVLWRWMHMGHTTLEPAHVRQIRWVWGGAARLVIG